MVDQNHTMISNLKGKQEKAFRGGKYTFFKKQIVL